MPMPTHLIHRLRGRPPAPRPMPRSRLYPGTVHGPIVDQLEPIAIDRLPYVPLELLNNTAVDLPFGAVVALHSSRVGEVEIAEEWRSQRRYVLATQPVPRGSAGRFCLEGYHPVRCSGVTGGAGAPFQKDDGSTGLDATALPYAVTGLVEWTIGLRSSDVTPPRWALGYLVQDAPFSGGLAMCYWIGVPSEADNFKSDITIRDDFLSFKSAAGNVVVPSVQQWWCTGAANADLDQGPGGKIVVAGNGAGVPGQLYLTQDDTGIISKVINVDMAPVVRCRWAQRTATAGTRWIGLMGTFAGAEPADGIFFRHVVDGPIFGVCRSGGVEAPPVDTTFSASAGGDHWGEFRVRGNGLGSYHVHVYLDDQYCGKITTNVPTVNLGFGAQGSVATAGVGLTVDRMEVLATRI